MSQVKTPRERRPPMTEAERQSTAQYLQYKIRQAERGIHQARTALPFDTTTFSTKQLAYWSSVKAGLEWAEHGLGLTT